MRTGRVGPRWGARSFGTGAGKFIVPVSRPRRGEGASLASPASSPRDWSPLAPSPGLPRPPVAVPWGRVRRALPRGATRARPARSESAYLRAWGPAAKAGGKLPRPAGEHSCCGRCRLTVRVRAGASVCEPGGRAGGVRRASSVSGRRCRHRPQLPETHRWLRGPNARRGPFPSASRSARPLAPKTTARATARGSWSGS